MNIKWGKFVVPQSVIASAIIGVSLITSTVVLTQSRVLSKSRANAQPDAGALSSQAAQQLMTQIGTGSYFLYGQDRTVSNLVIDKCEVSPNGNRADIDFHLVWGPIIPGQTTCSYSTISLIKDKFGYFDSGNVSMVVGEKNGMRSIHVIAH